MAKRNYSRRKFLHNSLLATGGLLLAANFISCTDTDKFSATIPDQLKENNFNHGVASFDPTSSQVIIWTRYSTTAPQVNLIWQIATDSQFDTVVRSGKVTTDASRDYTVAIEIQGLEANQKLYYRFIQPKAAEVSPVGETLTFPKNADEIKIAICSCSNYPAGLFHAYQAMAKSDADVIVHLGDYIYEYAHGQYGTNTHTETLNRAHQPAHEIVSLEDYRTRYKQYRSDKDLQLAHQKKPFICVWDDHEIANNTYLGGAQNHQKDEGNFSTRKQNAIQAYSEYIAVRTTDKSKIYRSFKIGNLVNLIMLDTRVIGRDKQLEYATYFKEDGSFDNQRFQAELMHPDRTLLGTTQRDWFLSELNGNPSIWKVIGQQVLMGKMLIPMELLLTLNQVMAEVSASGSVTEATFAALTQSLTQLVEIKTRHLNNDPTLTEAELERISTLMPYNLDAWDGYPAEREIIFNSMQGQKVISLAGDTHNAWDNQLYADDGTVVGREFATSSVSSPGFESYLGIDNNMVSGFESALQTLIDGLNYLDATKRGFVKITFTATAADAEYIYIDNTVHKNFNSSTEHRVSYTA